MRRMLVALALTSMTTPTLAQSPPPAGWTGPYVAAGVSANGLAIDDTNRLPGSAYTEIYKDKGLQGVSARVAAGYDIETALDIVIGGFVEYEFSDQMSSSALPSSFRRGDSWSVGGRIGVLPTSSTLIYVPAGYTRAEFVDALSLPFSPSSADLEGWFVGGGIETRLAVALTLRGEYRFTQFEDWVHPGTSLIATTIPRDNSFIWSLSYRYGESESPAAPDTAPSWDGLYLGGSIARMTIHAADATNDTASRDGWSRGLLAGYDAKITPHVLVGAFAGVDWIDLKSSETKIPIGGGPSTGGIELNDSRYAGGRVGYLFSDSALVYVPFGYSHTTLQDLTSPQTLNLDGWFVGGGIEVAIAPQVFLRGEYRYTMIDGIAQLPGVELDLQSFRAALTFKPKL